MEIICITSVPGLHCLLKPMCQELENFKGYEKMAV